MKRLKAETKDDCVSKFGDTCKKKRQEINWRKNCPCVYYYPRFGREQKVMRSGTARSVRQAHKGE